MKALFAATLALTTVLGLSNLAQAELTTTTTTTTEIIRTVSTPTQSEAGTQDDGAFVTFQKTNKENAPYRADKLGVTGELIERRTFLAISRIEPKADGGLTITHSADFRPDEVLTINLNNKPVLMQVRGDGSLVPHPSRRVAMHQSELIIIDTVVSMTALQDKLFPAASYAANEKANTIQGTPIAAEDFDRPLPEAVLSPVSSTVVSGERPVSMLGQRFPSIVIPPGGRRLSLGHSTLILDSRGVIQDVILGPGALEDYQ